MATAKPKTQPVEPAPKKSSAWKQGLNKPKTNWASKAQSTARARNGPRNSR